MSERSEPRVTPSRLVLDFGDNLQLDGSMLYDPTSETAVPAAVLRMPPHRAAYIGKVLDAYTRVCRLAGTELTADERGPAWALRRTASAAGFAHSDSVTAWTPVTNARRVAAAAVLQTAEHLNNTTTIAVIDAAAPMARRTGRRGVRLRPPRRGHRPPDPATGVRRTDWYRNTVSRPDGRKGRHGVPHLAGSPRFCFYCLLTSQGGAL